MKINQIIIAQFLQQSVKTYINIKLENPNCTKIEINVNDPISDSTISIQDVELILLVFIIVEL